MENDIKILNNNYSQDVVLTIDGISKVIYHLENTGTDFYCNFINDGNYIIIYSTRIVDEDDPIYMTRFSQIRAIYDLNTNEMLNIDENALYNIQNMYISRKIFPVEVVLSLLTNHSFTSDKTQIEYFKNYLTSFNENISNEEIKKYIISCYPELNNFKNIRFFLLNKKKLFDVLHESRLSFHAMKQDIREYNSFYVEKDKEFRKKYMVY